MTRLPGALLLLSLRCGAQVIDIGFPVPYLIAGQEAEATAVVRSPEGAILTGLKLNWTSTDASVLAIDGQGKVTAAGLGAASIRVTTDTTGDVFAALELQVLPQRVRITPAAKEMLVGESFQFTAAAFNIRDEAIPAPFQWELSGENGRATNVGVINSDGVLRTSAAGLVTVRAFLPYPPREGKLPRVEALAAAAVKLRPEFTVTRLITNETSRSSFNLRPSPGAFSVNDAGQAAFTGSLDALSTGVLLHESGAFRLLINAGAPSPFPGGVVSGFQSVALNAKGQVLISAPAGPARKDGGLLSGTRDGVSFLLLDGASLGDQIIDLTFMHITPNSLNDNGDIVFRALYREPEAGYRDGLFRRQADGVVDLIWNSEKPLAGIPGKVNFILDSTGEPPGWSGPTGFGIDNQGTVWFIAQSTTSGARALFRAAAGAAPPVKVVAIGDAFLRSTVKVITDTLFLPNGDVVMRLDLNSGDQHVVRYSNGRFDNLQIRNSTTFRVLAANSRGGALFAGNALGTAGKGEGLYLWQGTAVTNVLLLTGPNRYVETAALTTAGQVYAVLRTDTNDFVVTQPGAANPTLFQAGTPMNVSANIHLNGLVNGTRTAPPYVLLGNPSSVFQLQPQGAEWSLASAIALGDRLEAGSAGFEGVAATYENAAGELYFATRGATWRLSGKALTKVVADNLTASDNVKLLTPKPWAVNNKGGAVVETNTNAGHRRLYLLDAGRLTLLMRTGTKSPFDGGTVVDWTQFALDDSGRVMAYFVVSGGGSGYFLYSGGAWQTAGLIGAFRIPVLGANQPVIAAEDLRTAGGKFYARLSLREPFSDSSVAEYVSANNWKALVTSQETLPTGATLGFIQSFDANAKGKIAFYATVLVSVSQVLGVRAPDGIRVVFLNSDATSRGDYLLRYGHVNLRDDDRLYFTAFDVNDRELVFLAEPR